MTYYLLSNINPDSLFCYTIPMNTSCIFCKIVSREIPAHIIYEDEHFLSFLDIRPLSPGHALIIPKKHFRWVWDIPMNKNESPHLAGFFEVAGKIAAAQRKAFGQEMILSKIVGEEVHHAHMWLYPSNETEGDKNDFEGNAKKIIGALK